MTHSLGFGSFLYHNVWLQTPNIRTWQELLSYGVFIVFQDKQSIYGDIVLTLKACVIVVSPGNERNIRKGDASVVSKVRVCSAMPSFSLIVFMFCLALCLTHKYHADGRPSMNHYLTATTCSETTANQDQSRNNCSNHDVREVDEVDTDWIV